MTVERPEEATQDWHSWATSPLRGCEDVGAFPCSFSAAPGLGWGHLDQNTSHQKAAVRRWDMTEVLSPPDQRDETVNRW